MVNRKIFIASLVTFLFPLIVFAQTSKSIELGTNISELKCNVAKKFLIIISHGSMADGYDCSYDSINYIAGVSKQNKVVFVAISDTNFVIDGVKYLKIKFKDLNDEVKANIRYELPFAYYIRINTEWFIAYGSNDTFVKKGKGLIKKNALPMFAFKREHISKKQQ